MSEMSICVIPDVHNQVVRAQRILDAHTGKVDLFVFLGDYFHSFGDKAGDIAITGRKVREWQNRADVVTLIGNHDLSHLNPDARCSGWTRHKHAIFFSMIGLDYFIDPDKLLPAFRFGNMLCTHAGVYEGMDDLDGMCNAVDKAKIGEAYYYELLDAHRRDGGSLDPAGILWGRHTYNKPANLGLFQVFGHTPGLSPVEDDNWLCLDTNLDHYAIFNFVDEKMINYTILETRNL